MWEHSVLMEGSDTMGADMIYGSELHLSRKEADGCGHLLNISIFLSCGSHKFSMSKVELIIFLPNFFSLLDFSGCAKGTNPSVSPVFLGFPGGSAGKESARNAGDLGSIPGLGRSSGEGNGYPLQYSCPENSIDRGAWQTTVHRASPWGCKELDTTDFHFTSLC